MRINTLEGFFTSSLTMSQINVKFEAAGLEYGWTEAPAMVLKVSEDSEWLFRSAKLVISLANVSVMRILYRTGVKSSPRTLTRTWSILFKNELFHNVFETDVTSGQQRHQSVNSRNHIRIIIMAKMWGFDR